MWRVSFCQANDTRRSPDWSTPSRWWEHSCREPRRCNGFSRSRIGMSAKYKKAGSNCCARTQRRLPQLRESWLLMGREIERVVLRRLVVGSELWGVVEGG